MQAPYPPDTRAKGWRFELDYEQIEQSSTWGAAKPAARPWLLMMWMLAWKQVPCGSWPADEEVIAGALGIDDEQWAIHRKALMRGWVEADDGRLYHSTITKRVIEMLSKRRSDADRKAADRARKALESAGSPPPVPADSAATPAAVNPESSTDHRPPSSSFPSVKKKARSAPWLPPEWVPAEPWSNFVEHRKAMRGVPFTDAARDGVLRELKRLRDAGHDPAVLLQTAVVRGWRTVFEPKGQAPPSKQSALESRNAETVKRLLAEDHATQ
jgi:hypothetical protein